MREPGDVLAELTEDPWYALPASEAVTRLETNSETGLTSAEAAARIERFGPNQLPEARRRSSVSVFLHQFASPLIYLLLAAAALAFALGELSDGIVIAVVVLLNAIIGAFQEGRAEHALAALRQLAVQQAHVVRDGHEVTLEARGLVPGDVLVVAAGDAVTADARVIDGAALQLAEAALTGESVPVHKGPEPVARETTLADRRSMLHAGTQVTAGRARAIVVGTGQATEIGKIAELAESSKPQPTPLEHRVAQFGRYIIVGAIATFGVFFAVGYARGLPISEILMLGISQVVGMIPEGLPVAMTVALAVGVRRMAARRAIVRRLAAVETLGSTTVICTDKTGTLTRNEMTATQIVLPDRPALAVTGSGYTPEGRFEEAGRPVDAAADPALRELLEAALLCNDAHLAPPDDTDDRWRAIGDPTEAALVTLAAKAGLDPAQVRRDRPRVTELPFDAQIKLMATQHTTPDGPVVYVKGAPEMVFGLTTLDDAARARMQASVEQLGEQALRVLAFARLDGELDPAAGAAGLRDRATWLGLIGQIDPPREEAAEAVAQCRTAGIRPVMVTGDHRATALAIARELGIARDGDLVLDSLELTAHSPAELASRLDRVAVFARVQPAQKLRIVEAYQQRGEVVAMTGDGVNDAPALMRADVGIAMGITGTDVAKQAAKIVITDDDFGTIVSAVEEGRVVYGNIKKAVLFLFATSLAEVIVLLLAVALGFPAPFAAVQILWNNLVTEGVITINLIMNPAEGDEMQLPPIPRDEPLVTRAMLHRLAVMTPAIVMVTLGWFMYRTSADVPFEVARSETFTLLAVCEWMNVLNCISDRHSALSLRTFRNRYVLGGLVAGSLLQIAVVYTPAFNRIFYTVPIDVEHVLLIGALASVVLWAEELRKLLARRFARRAAQREGLTTA